MGSSNGKCKNTIGVHKNATSFDVSKKISGENTISTES